MTELVVLKKQIPALAKAISSTESMAQTCSGPRREVLEGDIVAMRRRLENIDQALFRTPLYPCHCGLRMTQCPNRVGAMSCNLANKGA